MTATAPQVSLYCILTNDPNNVSSFSSSKVLECKLQEGTKSSFQWSAGPSDAEEGVHLDKPAHLVIQCSSSSPSSNNPTTRSLPFRFGGLELTSNARNVEAYMVSESKADHQEEYLKTARGEMISNDNNNNDNKQHLHKCVLVSPNGVETVRRIHLKLLSLRPAKTTRATLLSLTIKGRLPPSPSEASPLVPTAKTNNVVSSDSTARNNAEATPTAAQSATSASRSVTGTSQTTTPTQPSAAPPLTNADMMTAVAGVSMMVRGVEMRLMQSIRESSQRVERTMTSQMQTLFQTNSLLQQQQQQQPFLLLLQQQTQLLQQQQTQIQQQHDMIRQLQSQQAQLTRTVETLQSELQQRDDALQETLLLLSERGTSSRAEGEGDDGSSPPEDEIVELDSKGAANSSEKNDDTDAVVDNNDERHDDESGANNSIHGVEEDIANLDLNNDQQQADLPRAVLGAEKSTTRAPIMIMQQRDDPMEIPDLTPLPDADLLGLEEECDDGSFL